MAVREIAFLVSDVSNDRKASNLPTMGARLMLRHPFLRAFDSGSPSGERLKQFCVLKSFHPARS